MTAPPVRLLTAAVTLAAMACSSGGDQPASAAAAVLTISTPADADALIPPLVQTTQGKQTVDMLFDGLAQASNPIETVGDGGFRPQLARRWSWAPDSLSIAFEIDPAARWHDGAPVRASDVRFSFDIYTDAEVASPQASNFAGIDSVTVRDSLTAVVWWARRHPEQFFQIAYNLAVLPEHLLSKVPHDSLAQSAYASHPIGSGRYRFERWNRQHDLVLVADTGNYRGRPAFGRIVWIVGADPTAATLSVLSGQADMIELVRGDAFTQARRSADIRTVEYGSSDYGYLMFNMNRTVSGSRRLFADRAIRVAITESIDRASVVANALDSIGAVALGPFTRASASADTTIRQIPFDTAAASRTLDSLAWKVDPKDGIRRKSGQALQFEVLVPSSSATRQRIAVLLQAQLKTAGIRMEIASVEPGVFGDRLQKNDFDAALNLWRADPSPITVRQVWGSPQGKEFGANFGRYSNATFDALVDSASFAFSPKRRRELFSRAYQSIVDDAAAVWLYEPRNFAAVNRRIEPTGMRADAWWAELPQWRTTGASKR